MALGYMRRHKHYLKYFLWAVIAAFIILYVPAMDGGGAYGAMEPLGHVGERPITMGEFQRAYLEQRRFYDRLYQGRVTEEMLERMQLEQQVLQSLVVRRLVELEADRLGVSVPDDEVERRLMTSPEFQTDGKFIGGGEIRRRLELRGLRVKDFEDQLRTQLLEERLRSLITDGVGVTPAEVEREFRRRTEQVRVEYAKVDADRFTDEINPTDEDIQARFTEHRESYRIPERRVVSYVMLDAGALRARVTITDSEMLAYYQQNGRDFAEEEQVCASHVLIKVKADESDQQGHSDDEAKRLAQQVLDEAKAGADFGKLASDYSEDLGTVGGAGDLGCFGRGRMVPAFDAAVFALQPGEISELVKTDFGYHVIRQNSLRPGRVPQMEEVKERIRGILLGSRVTEEVRRRSGEIEAALRARKSLEDVAADHGLSVEKSDTLERGALSEPLTSPLIVSSAFGLEPGETESQGFPLPNGYAFIRLAEVQESRLPELAEVKDAVIADLKRERALERAREVAERVRSAAESGSLERAASRNDLVRKETPQLVSRGQALAELGTGAALEEEAFSLQENQLSKVVRVADGWAVLRALEKKPFDPIVFEQQKQQLGDSLRDRKANQRFQAYLDSARDRFPIQINPDAWERATNS